MKYVALLRGINVGGNNKVSMAELRIVFEKAGYTDVVTYINSGNVIFSTDEKHISRIVTHLETLLSNAFDYTARVMVFSHEQIKQIVGDIPEEWNTDADIRCYVGFLSDYVTDEMVKGVQLREGVDSIKIGKKALYMTTLMSRLTKSAFNKLTGTKIYKEMTIRNVTTVKKVLSLMEQK